MTQKFLCVYCGASETADDVFQNAATELGQKIATNDFSMVYGGGRLGLMGRSADAAVKHGAKVVGITTNHLDEREGAHDQLAELHLADDMHERKMRMSEIADAFLILPGGFGTLDEFFEILTWKQIKLHNKPIIVININGYWDALQELYNHIFDSKFAGENQRQHVFFAKSVDEAIDQAKLLLAEQ